MKLLLLALAVVALSTMVVQATTVDMQELEVNPDSEEAMLSHQFVEKARARSRKAGCGKSKKWSNIQAKKRAAARKARARDLKKLVKKTCRKNKRCAAYVIAKAKRTAALRRAFRRRRVAAWRRYLARRCRNAKKKCACFKAVRRAAARLARARRARAAAWARLLVKKCGAYKKCRRGKKGRSCLARNSSINRCRWRVYFARRKRMAAARRRNLRIFRYVSRRCGKKSKKTRKCWAKQYKQAKARMVAEEKCQAATRRRRARILKFKLKKCGKYTRNRKRNRKVYKCRRAVFAGITKARRAAAKRAAARRKKRVARCGRYCRKANKRCRAHNKKVFKCRRKAASSSCLARRRAFLKKLCRKCAKGKKGKKCRKSKFRARFCKKGKKSKKRKGKKGKKGKKVKKAKKDFVEALAQFSAVENQIV